MQIRPTVSESAAVMRKEIPLFSRYISEISAGSKRSAASAIAICPTV
jgi:hypothetical protein